MKCFRFYKHRKRTYFDIVQNNQWPIYTRHSRVGWGWQKQHTIWKQTQTFFVTLYCMQKEAETLKFILKCTPSICIFILPFEMPLNSKHAITKQTYGKLLLILGCCLSFWQAWVQPHTHSLTRTRTHTHARTSCDQ